MFSVPFLEGIFNFCYACFWKFSVDMGFQVALVTMVFSFCHHYQYLFLVAPQALHAMEENVSDLSTVFIARAVE